MRYIAIALLSVSLLVGCSNSASSENPMFNEDGNLKDDYANAMQEEWCSHNKGKDFAIEQCKEIRESE